MAAVCRPFLKFMNVEKLYLDFVRLSQITVLTRRFSELQRSHRTKPRTVTHYPCGGRTLVTAHKNFSAKSLKPLNHLQTSHRKLCFRYSSRQILSNKHVLQNFAASAQTARRYHSASNFSTKNPVFAGFVNTLVEEFESLNEAIAAGKLPEAQALRLHFLRLVIAVVEKLQLKDKEISELAKLIEVEEDKELRSLMGAEMEDFCAELKNIEEELIDTLVGEELADSNDIVLEVSAGVGGQEAMLFGAEMFEMYCNYAQYKGWAVSGMSEDESELGGSRKSSMEISGVDVYRHLKHEAGVHRVQRVPKTEKAGRIHTSTVSVSVVPKPKEIDIVIDSKDLKIETMRGSGPGGQSVNTTDSAVRITHLPTGTVSECRQERSQIKNRDLAMSKLKMRMYQQRLEEQETKRRATRKMQTGTRGRSEKIRTYNFQQDRISDHRLKGNINNIQEFMHGGEALDELVYNLELEEKYSSVQSMLDEYELNLKKKSGKS